jgi:hypothetical protein
MSITVLEPPKRRLIRPRPPSAPSCVGPGFLRCCDPDGCRELGCVRQFERFPNDAAPADES